MARTLINVPRTARKGDVFAVEKSVVPTQAMLSVYLPPALPAAALSRARLRGLAAAVTRARSRRSAGSGRVAGSGRLASLAGSGRLASLAGLGRRRLSASRQLPGRGRPPRAAHRRDEPGRRRGYR